MPSKQGSIEVWGDGSQTRSFTGQMSRDGTLNVMHSSHSGPFNIGSDEMATINGLVAHILIAGKDIKIDNVPGPEGVGEAEILIID